MTRIIMITIVVDSTASMGNALEAVKKAIAMFGSNLKMMGICFEIIFYGDYDNRSYVMSKKPGQKGKSVVEVIPYDKFFDRLLKSYKLNQNGSGGDYAEAGASAAHVLYQRINSRKEEGDFKELIVWVTDAPVHGMPDVVDSSFIDGRWLKLSNVIDGNQSVNEIKHLKSLGLTPDFKEIVKTIEDTGAIF